MRAVSPIGYVRSMPTRTSSARWQGDLKGGSGSLALGSGAFEGQYSFNSRFEDGSGTNPEELIAAAHAACYSMALSNMLATAGFTPDSVVTNATVNYGKVDGNLAITRIDLVTTGTVPHLEEAEFLKHAEAAKSGCLISRALGAVEITLDATLV
jgi:osmotically inducible protein OsmC